MKRRSTYKPAHPNAKVRVDMHKAAMVALNKLPYRRTKEQS